MNDDQIDGVIEDIIKFHALQISKTSNDKINKSKLDRFTEVIKSSYKTAISKFFNF